MVYVGFAALLAVIGVEALWINQIAGLLNKALRRIEKLERQSVPVRPKRDPVESFQAL